jgi:OmpA-OmpF porin, OOP family
MAMLDLIVNEVSNKFGLGEKAAPLVSALLSAIFNENTGGISGFLDKFKSAGMSDLLSSWVNLGENRPLTENQLNSALGSNLISSLASKAGIPVSLASSALSFLIPKMIDFLTPNGAVPTSVPPAVSSFLAGRAALSNAASEAASEGSSMLWKVLPLLLLAAVALFGFQYCNSTNETQTASTANAALTPTPIIPSINSTFTLSNDGGKIRFSGVVPDAATKQKILDELKAAYGEGNFIGNITVDPRAKPVTWLDKLAAALKSFTIPGAELSFDGDLIKVGGEIASDLKTKLLDSLKSIFGTGYTLSLSNLDFAAAAREAAAKTLAALSGLTGSASAEDLVKALNLNIINFASGSSAIPADQVDVLKKAAAAIKAAPAGTKLEISGHTDNRGLSDSNLKLSQARADSVKAYLVKNGVAAAELTAKGYGDATPVASNDTSEGRFQNRRIQFAVSR